ncbi:mas-related G-protein coupled receptor member D [Talpa occidentalis]|uniref:mas-related G-protein coupled receptor member D n=1 Tax=Talpa occidentalis TaxID=50954 RepID=UPI00188F4E27|nr:mas-related G-protein coupled receptor member D [Talpa occidentalis]
MGQRQPGPRTGILLLVGSAGMTLMKKALGCQRPEQMDPAPNGSLSPEPASLFPGVDTLGTAHWVLSALVALTCACGLAGNGLVIRLLAVHGLGAPFCLYVLHLAVADLLFLLCLAAMLGLETAPPAGWSPKAYEALQRVKYFAYTASLSLLTAISMQRCLSTLFPIWYKCHRPQRLSALVSTLLWTLALLLHALAAFSCSRFWRTKRWCFTVDTVFISLVLGIFTPGMVLSSGVLSVRVHRSSQQWRRRQPTRLYMVILASVLVFLVCSLPLGINWFLLDWLELSPWTKTLLRDLSRLSSSVSSSANPVIYFLAGRRGSQGLREPLGAVLQQVLREEPEMEAGETPSSGTNEGGV